MSKSKKPIKPDEVSVSVEPVEKSPNGRGKRGVTKRENKSNEDFADKVEKGLQKDVEKAVNKTAKDGRRAQKESIDETVRRVVEDLSPEKIEKVEVVIEGDEPISAKPKK